MAGLANMDGGRLWNWLRIIGWTGAAMLLMLPLIAMRYTSEVNWTLSDFLVMGALLGMAGLALELATRRSDNLGYRFASALAVAAAFLLVWVNGAVGFLGDEGNPANLMFLGVIGIAILGTLIVRARPAGMAQVLLLTAAAQLLAGIVGFTAGWAAPGEQGVYEVLVGTTLFTGLWLVSAFLYGKAARAGA
jgi:hypothetical protein